MDHSQWECWDEGKLCAKASCLGESGAVIGVLGGVWGGREGGMAEFHVWCITLLETRIMEQPKLELSGGGMDMEPGSCKKTNTLILL